MKNFILLLLIFLPFIGFGQNYTSYFTGNTRDTVTIPSGGICLMGGSTEDDNAMKWFLRRASGGDVLVLRATGSNGYNDYLYTDLGITVNSVESIVCNNVSSGSDPYIIQKIQQAEAIWFAGGDQWTYVTYWRNTLVERAINQAISQRNIVIGGTSAGMAIQGKYYFNAQNGTVTSANALTNPYNSRMTVDSTHFIENTILNKTITDTHFDNPDRKGRLVTFMARIYADFGEYSNAIACDQYTSVCIDTNGIARVFGEYPTSDDNAYFIQSNCGLSNQQPENCTTGNPLTWNRGGAAVKVYQIKGNTTGSNSFDLNSWQSGTGGTWYDWSVANGVLSELIGAPINCTTSSIHNASSETMFEVFPNPTTDKLTISIKDFNISESSITVYNSLGQLILVETMVNDKGIVADFSNLKNGLYFISGLGKDGKSYQCKVIKN